MSPIFSMPDTWRTYSIYVGMMILLALITFGSLSEHLFDAFDDWDFIKDTAESVEDISYLFSSDKITPVRPLRDLVFRLGYLFWADNPAGYHMLQVGLHLAASLLLAYTFRQFRIDLELSLLSALLFLMNVAHFRAVHWITCMSYTLALILILSVLIGYIRFLDSGRLRWIAISSGALAVAIFTHPAAVFVVLFCIYLTWRRSGSMRRTVSSTWPLVLVSLIFGVLTYLISPHVNQVQGMVTSPDPFRLLKNLFWLMGRLVTSAHWLPSIALSDKPTFWEIGMGLLACGGIVVLCRRKTFPVADWAVWPFLAILPFINHPPVEVRWLPVGPSRHLYFSSLGSSLVLAWALRSMVNQTGKWLNQESKQIAFIVLLVCLTAASIQSSKSAEAVSFYLSGRSYIAREAYEKGIDLYKRAIARSPRVVPQDVFFRLGSTLLGYGQFPQKIIEQGLARDPDSPRLGMLLGVSAFLQEDPEIRQKGEERIRRALEAAKDQEQLRLDTARAFQNLAGYYHQSRRYQEAEDLYVKALYIQPNYPLVLLNLSKTLYIQGKTDKAIRILQAAAKLDPPGTRALWDLGTMLRAQDRLEEAAETYRQILQIDPDDAGVYVNLGRLHYSKGRYVESVLSFEQAVALSPESVEAHLGLAQVYEKLDRIEQAVEAYRRVVTLKPNSPEAKARLHALRRRPE